MRQKPLDCDPESRRALEFDGVLETVAAHAATPAGARRVLALEPMADADSIAAEHALVAELSRHLATSGRILPRGLPDPDPALARLALEGMLLEPAVLRDLAVVLVAAAGLRGGLRDLSVQDYPGLHGLGAAIPDLGREVRPIVRHVLPDGRILDEASPELSRIRNALARTGQKLRRMLETLLHEPGTEAVIRDDFITQRNARYVIPIRADAPRAVRGIVHASSSSGATLFVEPLESVELNNDLVRLAEEEVEEERRIVAGWLAPLRARLPEVREALSGIAAADSLQARALFAAAAGGTRPRVEPGGPVVLRDVRHPLLDRRLRDRGGESVPVSLELLPSERVLLLSGPNAGGKTVALKTVGLAVLMAQAGIPVVAADARLPLYLQVRADIGDHQSIEADLSTFSAHVQAVARFLDEASPPALFLFDEIGTGTDPAEGAALARAVLERLFLSGCLTVATTHQGSLKAWAFTTPGAVSAALEFDAETLRPTYRIVMGAAGASAGVEIAARLGLDEAIVSRAREHLGSGSREVETLLSRLKELATELEGRRARLVELEEDLGAQRLHLTERAAQGAERMRREATTALETALREFRDDARRELAAIKDKKEKARLEREQIRAESRLAADLSRKMSEVASVVAADATPAGAVVNEPTPGMRVRVHSLGREGVIEAVRGDRIEVKLGAATFTVSRSDLRAAAPAGPPAPSRARVQTPPRRGAPRDDLSGGPGREVVLIGKTVEEALGELDKFLDDAALAGHEEIRIVHGHGTGRLRAAVRRFLSGHPHAESHRPGSEHEGGDGATVVRLK